MVCVHGDRRVGVRAALLFSALAGRRCEFNSGGQFLTEADNGAAVRLERARKNWKYA